MNSALQSDTGPNTNYKLIIAQFTGLDTDLTYRRPHFNSRANSMEFMLNTTALQQDYLGIRCFSSLLITIPLTRHT